MAVTKVDIASRALIMIGANPISSFTDGSTESLVTNNIYEEIVESTLTRHKWRFATGQRPVFRRPVARGRCTEDAATCRAAKCPVTASPPLSIALGGPLWHPA